MLDHLCHVLTRFLHSLHDHGRAELAAGSLDLSTAIDVATDGKTERAALRLMEEWHDRAVLDLPGHALAFHPLAAQWGAHLLFRAACLVAFRDLGENDISRWLRAAVMPDAENPAAHFSADLCLRHWAALYRMARSLSEDDPLVKEMERIVLIAPLAAAGMHQAVDAPHALFQHAGLAQLFAERALERADTTCLAIPAVHSLLRSKLGSYSVELSHGLLPTVIES